jgi:uncharacterized repeat protein (TIGR01451 family)
MPAVWAAPAVTSQLQVHQVVHEANGDVLKTASAAKPGDVLAYQATYSNGGDSAAAHLMATLPIPGGTSLIASGIDPTGAQATVDGTTYAPMPLMHTVVGKDGKSHQVPVPLADIRGLRWDLGTLAPHQSKSVQARVHVNAPTVIAPGAAAAGSTAAGS